ncbi:MAG: hypothetical protein ACYC55_03965 [Candidatus Geothermincolia bacterium]
MFASRSARTGLIIAGLGFLVGAGAAFAEKPLYGVIMIAVTAAIVYPVYKRVIAPQIRQSALQRNGKKSEATVLSLTDTGWTVNQSPQVKLLLRVEPPEGEPFETELKTIINRLQVPRFQPGAKVGVVYDAATRDVALSEEAASEPAIDKAAIEERLQEMQQVNEEILASGKEAPATVVLATWMGVNVNGANPLTHFLLEVRPPGEEAFNAETSGVIAEASVGRYQPGDVITVKYDPRDHARVALFHS